MCRSVFHWVLGYSAAVGRTLLRVDPTFRQVFNNPAKVNSSVRLVWVSCGRQDFLYQANKEFVRKLQARGIHVTFPGDGRRPSSGASGAKISTRRRLCFLLTDQSGDPRWIPNRNASSLRAASLGSVSSFKRPVTSISSDTFTQVMFTDLIPMIERTYRILPGRENRAFAALSRGGALRKQ